LFTTTDGRIPLEAVSQTSVLVVALALVEVVVIVVVIVIDMAQRV